jgi:RNA polymerase sigma-70 factor (ECF subfamily)
MPRNTSRAAESYRQYGKPVYRCCLRILRDPDAARDATQDVFLRLVGEEERMADRATLLPWLYRVARNHCLNLRRDRRDLPSPEADPGAEFRDTHLERSLALRLLRRFDTSTQAVVVGVIIEGMDHQEVAAALGVSRITVARKLKRFLSIARGAVELEPARDRGAGAPELAVLRRAG